MRPINGYTDLARSVRTERRAFLRLSYELLESLLHFPSGHILAVRDSERSETLELVVESSEFEPVMAGSALQHKTIRYTSETATDKIVESTWTEG